MLLFLVLTLLMDQQTAIQPTVAQVAPVTDINTLVMDATFRIYGPTSKPNTLSTGTAFLMGKPIPGQTDKVFRVLVTAAHVLNDISGDYAQLVFRVKDGAASYKRAELRVQIRRGGKALYAQHKSADVVAMYLALPSDVTAQPIPEQCLATDETFRSAAIHPGEEVLTAGYPQGLEANEFGFPILRSGLIASFPLVPAATLKTFAVDFSVFGGNSGGPIFMNMSARQVDGGVSLGQFFWVLGLVSNQVTIVPTGERLNVAGIVFAQFIKETMDLLPAAPSK